MTNVCFFYRKDNGFTAKIVHLHLDKSYSVILIISLYLSVKMKKRDRDKSILRSTVTDGELVSFKFFLVGRELSSF